MARFENEHTLLIDNGPRIHAGRVVIATGSRSNVVPFLNDAGSRLVTNEDLFDWEDLPESVAVFGPGLIGLEIGQALARLDVRVTMFGVSGAVGGIQDPDMRRMALETFNREFSLDPDAETTGIREVENGVEVSYRDDNGNEVSDVVFEYVLAATGRRPNVDGLALRTPAWRWTTGACRNSIAIPCAAARVPYSLLATPTTNCHSCTKKPPTKAGSPAPTPAAIRKFTAAYAARRFRWCSPTPDCVRRLDHPANRRAVPRSFAVGSVNFADQGRSRILGRNLGLLRVYGEHGTGRFMGAEMFAPAAEHIAHLLAWSAQQHMCV